MLKPEKRNKGYKVTNNKRFLLRQIKEILYQKFITKNKLMNLKKYEKDRLFYDFYFSNEKGAEGSFVIKIN